MGCAMKGGSRRTDRYSVVNMAFSGLGRLDVIATGYGLEIRGSNPGVGEIFRTRPDRPWGPPTLLYNGYRVFPGGKASGK
jgi:hypothetical protein